MYSKSPEEVVDQSMHSKSLHVVEVVDQSMHYTSLVETGDTSSS